MDKYKVNVDNLDFTTRPVTDESARILVLHRGHVVTKIAASGEPGWWQVAVSCDREISGYVESRCLDRVVKIPAAHLKTSLTVTREKYSRRYSLSETGRPGRVENTATELTRIIDWLGVTEHKRYRKSGRKTYCNIYAHDYCHLAGVYLPRVWWNGKAVFDQGKGEQVDVIYGETVHEMSANRLYDWLIDFSADFGWTRLASVTDMQKAANNGEVCIISARNRDSGKSGHICAVVPETDKHKAVRKNDKVLKPLLSSAGSRKHHYQYKADNWWSEGSSARQYNGLFGFWKHP